MAEVVMDPILGGGEGAGVRDRPASGPDAPAGPAGASGWRLWLPRGTETGLHAETDGEPSGLLHAGENWAGDRFAVADHEHRGWELFLQLHGASRWEVGGHTLHLAPGWLVAVPPGTRHRTVPRARGGGRHHFAYAAFDADVVGRRRPALAGTWPARTLWTAQGASLTAPLRALLREVAEHRSHGDVALEAALDLVVVEAARCLLGGDPARPRMPRSPVVAQARRLLDDTYDRPWRLDELAAACAVSRARLAELFSAEVGQPPYAYLLERRVERAAELLRTTTRSVAEVAAEVGFSSHAQLGRAFGRVTGTTPREWRRRSRAG
ncbi:helix-turn-helix domain-containing protein [Geodermatophilus sp. SYSU D00710]